MSLNFSIANVVYVKNLSTDVSEKDIKEKFESCDEIINITFKNFPGKNQKYCQIEFKSSEGITKASRLNGELLLNVPMVVTVIEPVSHNFNEISNNENEKNLNSDLRNIHINNNIQNNITNQNVQNILLQKQLISEQKKGLVDFQNSLNAKNNKFDVFSKIVYMENIPENFDEEDIKKFFKNVGKTTNYKIQYNEHKKLYTAFVEFKNEEHAKAALNLNGNKVGKNEICIRDAYSLINEKDILKNNFSLCSNSKDDINVSNKQTVNEKVEKVLALKEKLTLKLCAMYKPNLLLVNNLVKANPFLLNTNIENEENKNIEKCVDETKKEIINNSNDIKLVKSDIPTDKSCEEEKKMKKRKNSKSKYSNSILSGKSYSDNSSRSSSYDDSYRRSSKTSSKKKKILKKHKSSKRRKKYKSRSKSSYYYSRSNSRSSYESEKLRYKKKKKKKYRNSSSSYSDSSYSSRRKYRESSNYKPWWVKESEKMQMRQRMKEKQMREIAMREKYRR
ncbi:RNA-binding protein, putative [Plasmodium gallinaceum]|uniref:RNA-binding protein, putative n=1 Tax=Plasmodium gallinaceum TaxID=5849 RepID=A0A1J1GML0_PLAGA|nr:RNA-binding protein, putative [Plasmodium gallinaceum]CRG93641.1 RNA-binding protein, putative [Plasmodium gallinaceum]